MVTWQSLGHLIWGGLGMAALLLPLLHLCRRCRATHRQRDWTRARHLAAFVAAMAFCLSGYISAQWTAGLLLQADAWVPWCGLGALVLARGSQRPGWPARAGAILAGAAPLAAAFLLGEIFIAAMGAMFAADHRGGGSLVAPSARRDRGRRASRDGAGALAAAAGLRGGGAGAGGRHRPGGGAARGPGGGRHRSRPAAGHGRSPRPPRCTRSAWSSWSLRRRWASPTSTTRAGAG